MMTSRSSKRPRPSRPLPLFLGGGLAVLLGFLLVPAAYSFPYPGAEKKPASAPPAKPSDSGGGTTAPAPAPPPKPSAPAPKAPEGPKPPGTARGQLGLTPEQSLDLLDQLDMTLQDLGTEDPRMNTMHRLMQDPEMRARINAWLAARQARQQAEQALEDARNRKAALATAASHYRDLGRTYRANARSTNDPRLRTTFENLGTAMDDAAETMEIQSNIPSRSELRSMRGDIRDAQNAERRAESGVDPAIRRLIDDIDQNPAPRPQQQRVTIPPR